jgi:excisionase family DNA binding protein
MPMVAHTAIESTELMTAAEVAAMLRVEQQTLALWRCTGRSGLRFIRIGKSIRYRRADVNSFLERNTATSCAALDAVTA